MTRDKRTSRRVGTAAASLAVGASVLVAAFAAERPASHWWEPGSGEALPARAEYDNAFGRFGILNAAGRIDTRENPFFEPLGTNGRACVSCHQPSDGMALSLASINERWQATSGKDPIFAPVDGANCPNLPAGKAQSHSLLLQRGLFRVGLPWPPRDDNGQAINPEFTLEVVRDPTGCNSGPEYGINAPAARSPCIADRVRQ